MAAATLHPSPVPTPSSSSPPTPPYPAFPRLPSSTSQSISRNASTSSSRSTASSSSSLVAVPIRPPPIETRTAATTPQQLPSRPTSADPEVASPLRGKYTSPRIGAGRGIYRNGPRARHPDTPPIITSPLVGGMVSRHRERPNTAPNPEMSPTTPRGNRWRAPDSETMPTSPTPAPIRVTVSMDMTDSGPSSPVPQYPRGRHGMRSIPSSPVGYREERAKARTLSADRDMTGERERRQSQASAHSSHSGGQRKPSLRDFVLGEELGRGSYSTVFSATPATSTHSPNSPRGPPREYAIKVIDQAHLIAEKKVKYAMIERDALIRLAQPSHSSVPSSSARGHRRGLSNSSSGGFHRKSNQSMSTARRDSIPSTPGQPRLSIATDSSSVKSAASISSVSPTIKGSSIAGRRPSRSAEPPEIVPERSEENIVDISVEALRSTAPSPVKEESPARQDTQETVRPHETDSPLGSATLQTPDMSGPKSRKRRQSLAPSERSVKSGRGGQAHPGVIRLHSTFNDHMSLYFVLDLAKNGEMLGYLRKYGSLDIDSARYYAALLIDTIEFMHERGVIHRDLKPENILLDADMRTKVTDFGSAKIVKEGEDVGPEEERKRSFVGSADFVSPEVLRNDPAVAASDIWAFGCIMYQYLVGRPPFRGATDYLTFQKILKREMEMPDELNEQAKSLIDLVLNPEPTSRPTPAEIKSHPFFASIDFTSLWTIPAVPMRTGITPPIASSANPTESDIWAVFDEGSDGDFDEDDENEEVVLPEDGAGLRRQISTASRHRQSPHFDHKAAAKAVLSVDDPSTKSRRSRLGSGGSLEPPRFSWTDAPWRRKRRGLSAGSTSARTSSSSSANRTALTGLLETMGISSSSGGTGSGATTAVSGSGVLPFKSVDQTDSPRHGGAPPVPQVSSPDQDQDSQDRWRCLLRENETVSLVSHVNARPLAAASANLIPAVFLPASKRRLLVLTDLPRVIEIKDDPQGPGPRIKFEVVFDTRESTPTPMRSGTPGDSRPGTSRGTTADDEMRFTEVTEKGPRGFVIGTTGNSVLYVADSAEVKGQWVFALRGIKE